MKNLVVGQSGGPTAVINASLAGVIHEAIAQSEIEKVYGMIHGVEGLLKGNLVDLKQMTEEEIILLKTTPASYLGSCRFKLPSDMDSPVYSELFAKMEEANI